MRKIDLENHFYDRSLIAALGRRNAPPMYDAARDVVTWCDGVEMPQGRLLPLLYDVGEERLRLMDALGIETAVLSSSPGAEALEPAESADVCRTTNRALYELTRRYPGRYLGSAALPVQDVPAALAELERCVEEYGFVAWHTHSNYGSTAPDDPRYRPLFRRAAELGVYVYLHPQLADDPRVKGYGFGVAGPALGFTVDTMATIVRMIVSGLFDEIPDLTVFLGHLGEAMPFLLDRLDNRIRLIPSDPIRNREAPSHYFRRNIVVTVSGNLSPAAFRCTKDVLGIDRICFGSDHPFEDAAAMARFVEDLPLTVEEREKLCFRNAERLLRRR
jgi:predicted TIM-barrel fold metal-dependent hydrolase